MSDIPKEIESAPEADKSKPLSDAQRNRIASAMRGTDDSGSKTEETAKAAEAASSEAADMQAEQKPETFETLSSEKAASELQELRARYPEKTASFDALDETFPGMDAKKMQVLEAGTQIPDFEDVNEPTTVFRYHDGINQQGRWVSPKYISDIRQRQDELALPTAGVLADRYELQPRCRILRSTAAAYDGHKGGGEQFFVLDLDKMKRV
jgi:hypothetical protein